MQQTSELYQTLLRDREHVWEVRAVIAGEEYGEDRIVSLRVSGDLYADGRPGVGGCPAREIDLTVRAPGQVPAMAEIRPYLRLRKGETASEWLPKGVFFVDTRSRDEAGGTLTLKGYDAMLKAGQRYLAEGDQGEWPRSMAAVAAHIAGRMGVTLDGRSPIKADYRMGHPGDYTMRELLGYIAAAHGGNWVITDQGRLRLVTLGELPREQRRLVTETGRVITLGGTALRV